MTHTNIKDAFLDLFNNYEEKKYYNGSRGSYQVEFTQPYIDKFGGTSQRNCHITIQETYYGFQMIMESCRLLNLKTLQEYNIKNRKELYIYDAKTIEGLKKYANMACPNLFQIDEVCDYDIYDFLTILAIPTFILFLMIMVKNAYGQSVI